ncbi:hypothetical protein Tco_0750659 [Tanacetum coccineum]|uniref:Uncharacterized protein n=1 Tax=Tanacetum coccineum TaxID=301880 RepID=A0ABQ4Z1T6_9ASTR
MPMCTAHVMLIGNVLKAMVVQRLLKKLEIKGRPVDEEERSLDVTTPRELIGPDGRLIVKDPALGVPRQSYHSDRCASVFEYMVGHYRVSLDRYYAPPEYDEQ